MYLNLEFVHSITTTATACCFIGWKTLVSHIKRTQTEEFESRVLRKMFGGTWDKLTGGWRKMHSDELHGLYTLSNITQVII
jgi:hypothetical protein